MNYYINPMWFYWARVISNLRIVVAILIAICGIALIIVSVNGWADGFGYGTEEENKRGWKIVFRCYVAYAFLVLLFVFLPSRDTLIEMMIAKNLTEQNVQNGIEVVKGAVGYIVQAIQNAK